MAETISQRHEREFAGVIPRGRRVAGSGSKRESHDVSTEPSTVVGSWDFRDEWKATQRKSYSLKLQDWLDLVGDVYSRSAAERPAWAVRFYGEEGTDPPVKQDLVRGQLGERGDV